MVKVKTTYCSNRPRKTEPFLSTYRKTMAIGAAVNSDGLNNRPPISKARKTHRLHRSRPRGFAVEAPLTESLFTWRFQYLHMTRIARVVNKAQGISVDGAIDSHKNVGDDANSSRCLKHGLLL